MERLIWRRSDAIALACTAMPGEHYKMLKDYRKALEAIVEDIKLLEADVNPSPPRAGVACNHRVLERTSRS